MKKAKYISQPTLADEKELNAIHEDKKDVIKFCGVRWRVGYMRAGTRKKVTKITLNEKDDSKVNSKCAAAMLLNGFWKIKMLYWLVWRWFYYIKQVSDAELLQVIELCKKKVQLEEYFVATISLTEMRNTIMTMTRAEVERFRQESVTAQLGASEKNTPS